MSAIAAPLGRPYPHASIRPIDNPIARTWGPRVTALIGLIWAVSFVVGFKSALAVMTATGFALAIVGVRWPFVGLLGIGIICALDSITRSHLMTGGFLRFNTFNYWLLIVMVLGAPALLRRNDPHTRLLQLFILLLLVQLAFSPDIMSGMLHTLNLVAYFGVLVYFVRAANDDAAWFWLALVLGTLSGVGMLAYYLQWDSMSYMNNAGLAGLPLSALCSICLCFRLASIHRRRRLILILLAVINFWWVFLTGSGGSLILAIFCSTIFLAECKGLVRRVVLCGCAALIGGVTLSQFVDIRNNTLDRVDRLFNTDVSPTIRTSGRSDLVSAGWRVFLRRPLGAGTGSSRYEIAHSSGKYQGRRVSIHTLWVSTLAENGILGFLLLTGFIVSFAIVGWGKRKQGLLPIGFLATGSLTISFITNDSFGKGTAMLAAGACVLLHRADAGK